MNGEERPSLVSLPIEILHDIHLLSLSPSLPVTSRTLYHLFRTTTSNRYRAIYLWNKHVIPLLHSEANAQEYRSRRKHNWDRLVTYPCCTLEVLNILRSFHRSEFVNPPLSKSRTPGEPVAPRVVIQQIPTRLFKPFTTVNVDRSLEPIESSYRYIRTLLTEFGTSANKTGGYPLGRSVMSRNLRLIRLLLDFDACPSMSHNLVIMICIRTGDLDMIRMLIEKDFVHPDEAASERGRERVGGDRVRVKDEMLDEALRHKNYRMADYFITKGARPTLKSLRLIES